MKEYIRIRLQNIREHLPELLLYALLILVVVVGVIVSIASKEPEQPESSQSMQITTVTITPRYNQQSTRANFNLTDADTQARLDRYEADVYERWACEDIAETCGDDTAIETDTAENDAAEGIEIADTPVALAAYEETENRVSRYPEITDDERTMLASMAYLESRGEQFAGQQAVIEVTLNRVISDEFPDDVESVLYQRGQYATASRIARTTPTQTQYDALDAALTGPWVLTEDYLYFNTAPVTHKEIIWLGNHAFSK